ncbi:coil containing protein [Vibrio phage 1.076.O._10N.286.51.B7]|nr:coil containing protein [Vibrio phage 1.076.O._10N.286.51.B7]
MATETIDGIKFIIDVDTNSVLKAEKKVDTSLKRMTTSITKLASGISFAILSGKIVSVQREFDRLNAAIKTSTGSAEKAAVAFSAIEKFAAETPYALAQSVEAFTKLVNFGLTPSERALRSFGDTAAAMGKDLTQMIEAVADAATGEFERLKEFGIKASNQGDVIKFTFRGVTNSVKNNAADIEEYLIKMGETNFGGAMAERMDTLDGKLSNLADSWDALLRAINAQGVGDIMEESVEQAIRSVQDLTDAVASGQVLGLMGVVAESWDRSFGVVAESLKSLTDYMLSEFEAIKVNGGGAGDFISDAFFNLAPNIKAAVEIAAVEVAYFVDVTKSYMSQLVKDIPSLADAIIGDTKKLSTAIRFIENSLGITTSTMSKDIASITQSVDESVKSMGSLSGDLQSAAENRLSLIESILSENEKETAQISKQRAEVAQLRLEYDRLKLSAEGGGDKLAQFKFTGGDGERGGAGSQLTSQVERLADKRGDPIAALQAQKSRELEVLRAAEEQGLKLHTTYAELRANIDKSYADQEQQIRLQKFEQESQFNALALSSVEALGVATTDTLSGLLSGTYSATEAMQQFANTILNNAVGALVEVGVQYLQNALISESADKAILASQLATKSVNATAHTAAVTATVAELSSLAAAGAFAATAAIPIVGPALAPAAGVAAGAATAGLGAPAIASAPIAGARFNGGPVSANSLYEVGEKNRPEMLMIPGNNGKVFSNAEMKSAMSGGGGGGGGGVNVKVINLPGQTAQVSQSGEGVSRETVIQIIAEQSAKVGSDMNRNINKNHNVTNRQGTNRRN